MAKVALGLGSNVGDRVSMIEGAITALRDGGIDILARSGLFETRPWGVTDQPRFVNMATVGETTLTPRDLLDLLKAIERELGRVPRERWGPREIDIDLLLYEEQVVDETDLQVPHPLMQDRDFVLVPLAQIAPDWRHPILQRTISELAEALTDTDVVPILS